MEPEGRAIPAQALVGNWRCRQIKLGRMTSYMVYDGWFSCNIRPLQWRPAAAEDERQPALHRLPVSGEWRLGLSGRLQRPGEPWHNYSGASASVGAQVTPDDQIGLLTGIGDNHLRLEIPAVQESLLDVVEFKR